MTRLGAPAVHWTRFTVVGIVAAIAAWLIVRATLHGLLGPEYPLFAVALVPASADVEAAIAVNRVGRAGGQVDARSLALAQGALARAPLLAEPLVVAGLDASARDNDVRARQLFDEAAQRDPRSVIARYWLFDDDLRRGDYAGGIAQAGPIVRLQPAAAIAVATVLTALLDVPAARPALATALRGAPPWRRAFVQQARATPRLAASAAPLLGADRSRVAVFGALVRAGRIEQAYALWRVALPAGMTAQGGIYDGRFVGLPGSPPFNWALKGERQGFIRRREGGGLELHAPDDRPRPVAEQVVPLAPGSYLLSFDANQITGEPTDGAVRAAVRCTGGKSLARRTFAIADAGGRSLPFAVPAACRAVHIQFAVAPGITSGPVSAILDRVRLSDPS